MIDAVEADPKLLAELTLREIPTVLLDTGKTGPRSANISINYARGIHEALQHLVSLNHRRIAFIAGLLDLQSARIRQQAFLSLTLLYSVQLQVFGAIQHPLILL